MFPTNPCLIFNRQGFSLKNQSCAVLFKRRRKNLGITGVSFR